MMEPFIIGLILTIGLISVSWITGLYRERGVYAVTLIAIAFFYIVFALEHGDTNAVVFNTVVAALFVVLALFGYLRSLTVVAFGLILHGVFDGIYLLSSTNPSPEWWAPFCFAVDIALGIFLVFLIKTSKITNKVQ